MEKGLFTVKSFNAGFALTPRYAKLPAKRKPRRYTAKITHANSNENSVASINCQIPDI